MRLRSHIEIMDGEYNAYFWPCIAVWVFDRVVRIGRLAFFNLPLRSATVSYNLNADIMRLYFPTPKMLKLRPGTYYYIYILHGFKLWESHPFTLSGWIQEELGVIEGDTRERKTISQPNLSFVMRPHDSFTKRLRESIMQRQGNESSLRAISTSLRILIEGPYGHHLNLKDYDSLLLIVGGTGITVAMSQLCDLYSAVHNCEPVAVRRIRLIWALRDIALFDDVYENELKQWFTSTHLQDKIVFEIQVYVTSEPTSPSNEASADNAGSLTPTMKEIDRLSSRKLSSREYSNHLGTKAFQHRPRIEDVVSKAVKKHASDGAGGKLAVVSCGPPRMADDTRSAVVMMLGEGYGCVDFYPESFTW
jgi:Ferric reductase NAD binding domain/FAD-binding domain